jgi:hypothetical protein
MNAMTQPTTLQPFASLSFVRAEIPLTKLNDIYALLKQVNHVLREGAPETRDITAAKLVDEAAHKLDAACGFFLAPRN